MAKLDEDLRRELERVIAPGDPTGAIEGVASRKRRRRRAHRVGTVLLAFAVIAGTVAGTYGLIRIFDAGILKRPAAWGAGEGLILFSGRLPERGADFALFTVDVATGDTRIVPGSDVGVPGTAAWSPDGTRIAFTREEQDGILLMDADGTNVRRLTDVGTEPTWSPDGSMLAFMNDAGYHGIFTVDVDGITQTWIAKGGWPAWSPDGSKIVFDGPEGLMVKDSDPDTTPTPLGVEGTRPDWSPDGSMLTFVRDDGIYIANADGAAVRRLTTAPGSFLDPSWSPDGSMIAFAYDPADDPSCTQNGCPQKYEVWVMNADGSGARQLTDLATNEYPNRGTSPDWQPVPAGASVEPLPTNEPTESPTETVPPGRDIGLSFPLCNLETLGGIDFLGDGSAGRAWTGTPVRDNGSCPDPFENSLVAADFTGDGLADSWWGPIEYCVGCAPYDATDLDADGDEELVLLAQYSSTPQFLLFSVQRGASGQPDLRPIKVAPPGNPEGHLTAGEPASVWTGGDEGFVGAVACEGHPEAPVLVVAWSNHPIEGPGSETSEIHVTRLALEEDGALHVIESADFTQPTAGPLPYPFGSSGRACGVDFGRM